MNWKRILVAVCLATVCLTATTAKQKELEDLDLTEIGIESLDLTQLEDSTVVALMRIATEHKAKMQKEEMLHEEQLMMIRKQSRNGMEAAAGVLFIVGIFAIIPVICILIYKIIVTRSRRRREEAHNEMLLNLVTNGQTLTPELVEAITHDKEQKEKSEVLSMNTSLRKLFLGCGLIVFAIAFYCLVSGQEPISPIVALIGIFYAAQGLAGYLTLKQERHNDAQQPANE